MPSTMGIFHGGLDHSCCQKQICCQLIKKPLKLVANINLLKFLISLLEYICYNSNSNQLILNQHNGIWHQIFGVWFKIFWLVYHLFKEKQVANRNDKSSLLLHATMLCCNFCRGVRI